MKFTLLTLILLASPVCRGTPLEVELPGESTVTALFGLPFTDDSQFAQFNHTGLYKRRLTVRPFAPVMASIHLQMFEPVVRVYFTENICQPLNAFYPYRE